MDLILIISNNPQVRTRYPRTHWVSGSPRDVFIQGRDYVHQGYCLLSHPLAGSLKPYQTPYRSLVLKRGYTSVDLVSLSIIEQSIRLVDDLGCNGFERYSPQVLEDLQIIDYCLFNNAITEERRDIEC